MQKMTQRDYFNELINLATENDRLDLVEFCNGRIAQLDKKSANRSGKSAEKVAEQETVMNAIAGVLADADSPMTVTEIIKAGNLDVSNQKASAMLKKLVDNGTVTKATADKPKRTVFSIA